MRYLSLFSGLGGAELAFGPLGWECVAVSEIDSSASAVLKFHWPHIQNLGDIKLITEEQIQMLGHIDLVIFGFPCQDLSVAGKRAGLKDKEGENTRSGLFFDAMRVVRWSKARWAVAENVPGLFSSNEGKDFASVVGEMVGLDIYAPGEGWDNSGVVLGPDGLCEWTVLDAQFFGVPQRRRRVFFVRDIGDWQHRQPVLFEQHSLQWHPAPRKEKGQGTASTITGSSPSRRNGGSSPTDGSFVSRGDGRGDNFSRGNGSAVPDSIGSLCARDNKTVGNQFVDEGKVFPWPAEIAPTLDSHFGDKQGLEDQHVNGGCGLFVPAVVGSLACNSGPNGHDAGNFKCNQAVDAGHVIAFDSKDGTLGNGDITSTVTTNGDERHAGGRQAVAFMVEQNTQVSLPKLPSIRANETPNYAVAFGCYDEQTPKVSEDVMPTLRGRKESGGEMQFVGYALQGAGATSQNSQGSTIKENCSFTLNATDVHGVAFHTSGYGGQVDENVSQTLQASDARLSNQVAGVISSMQVRRLTPTECERLQGIPDGFTKISSKSADGPRYKMIGNGFAIPVISWIGERIDLVEKIIQSKASQT